MRKEILLAHFPKLSVRRYQHLLAAFSSIDRIWEVEFDDLKKINWDDDLIHEFLIWRDNLNVDKIAQTLEKEKTVCLTRDDPNYPTLLKTIYDPPFCLFVRGTLREDDFYLAAVGTRKYSAYGKQVTEELIAPLASQGITIVSGLAFGIDSIAHEATLRANGRTVAVLGSGIDQAHIYPVAHARLADQIISAGGAIISEYPPGSGPTRYTFPERNRIIAGMSLGTLVVEAAEQSGALITAQCAIDNGREVFAVPQNITSRTSIGPNNLLKAGAKVVTKAEDILDALNLHHIAEYVTNKEIIPDSQTEAELLKHLSREPVHVDLLIKNSGLPSPSVNSALILMEMKGKVRNLGGMMYVLAR